MPKTKPGRWSVGFTLVATIVFAVNTFVTQSGNQVTSTNGVETLTNPEKVNDSGWALALMYAVFAGFVFGGVLGVMSLFRHERGVLVYLTVLAGVVALMIFVGGFFDNNSVPAEVNSKTCSSDNDCVVAAPLDSKRPCCTTCGSEAISRQAEKERSAWRGGKNCTDAACPLYDCYESRRPLPRCIESQCRIEWVERDSVQ